MTTKRHSSGHTAYCVKMALVTIEENNEATLALEPGAGADRLTPVTEAEAVEWLANGNASCHDPESCQH